MILVTPSKARKSATNPVMIRPIHRPTVRKGCELSVRGHDFSFPTGTTKP